MIGELYSKITYHRSELEKLNTSNPNPQNPKTLKENWKYPPCYRYIGGKLQQKLIDQGYSNLPYEYFNMYFKGSNWKGSGYLDAKAYFYENCAYVVDGYRFNYDNTAVGMYPLGIAHPQMYDTEGNEGEMKFQVTFENGTGEPRNYLTKTSLNGMALVRYVNSYNAILKYLNRKDLIDFV